MATPFGLVGGLVCYDLRFPEISRQHAYAGATLLIVSAQWPKVRRDHWQALLRARAIENQVFLVACNGCGSTGGNELGGTSMVSGPDGSILAEGSGESEEAVGVALDGKDLARVRERFCPPGERPRRLQDRDKCVDLKSLLDQLAFIRKQGSRVAFTNGCFDILHSGHVAYLEAARQTADCLVVGLNSDSSVRSIKGDGRPINGEKDRARVLAGLGCVDFVVLFSEDTPLELITTIEPDVLVKGADWQEEDIVGGREVKSRGGEVVRVLFEHDRSTTEVISRIRSEKTSR